MSNDTIYRQAAIDAINHELRCGAVIDQCGLETAYDLIEELPSAQPEQRWIPCTPDTMPEVENNIGARVLITASWGLVREAYYCIDHWEIDDIPYKLTSVIAWMPMPEPYKPPTKSQYRRMKEQRGDQE